MKTSERQSRIAVRTIDLSRPLHALDDVQAYSVVRIYVICNNRPLGSLEITNDYQPISATRLREVIVDTFALKLIDMDADLSPGAAWSTIHATLTRHYTPVNDRPGPRTTIAVPPADVSVVVATRDRPDDLRGCLRCLAAQATPRRVEIVVVDNNPDSGVTPAVVAEFSGVVLASERRKGLSYARNTGFCASTGEIIIATDDDVTMPPDWLEKLVAPFSRRDVMIVTGNILPMELETRAQYLFEAYGGLGKGFERFEADGEWFDHFNRSAVPTWILGATANAAFRAAIFSHPQIGLLDEALGAGTPTGCSEDTDLFYKVLKAGYTIVYEPDAYVWHRHRRDMPALRNQIYSYSKGHVAYHLTTLFRDRDLRALHRLAVELPGAYLWRINERLHRRSTYPLSLMLLEIKGNLAGPLALWQSRRQVKRKGRSAPYVPVSQRSSALGGAHEHTRVGAQ